MVEGYGEGKGLDLLVCTPRARSPGGGVFSFTVKVTPRSTNKTQPTTPAALPIPHKLLLQRWKQSSKTDVEHPFSVDLERVAAHSEIEEDEYGHGDWDVAVECSRSQGWEVDDGPPVVGGMDGSPVVGEPVDVDIYVEEVDGDRRVEEEESEGHYEEAEEAGGG